MRCSHFDPPTKLVLASSIQRLNSKGMFINNIGILFSHSLSTKNKYFHEEIKYILFMSFVTDYI